jgi:hypothetical protein
MVVLSSDDGLDRWESLHCVLEIRSEPKAPYRRSLELWRDLRNVSDGVLHCVVLSVLNEDKRVNIFENKELGAVLRAKKRGLTVITIRAEQLSSCVGPLK